MMHAHWMALGPMSRGPYIGVVREFGGDEPVCVAVTPCGRALAAFAEGYAQEPLRDWRDRLLDEETRDIPAPPPWRNTAA